ncbi:MAG: hypothetical protein FMNOHCHN_03831 [Ignavibacteriaceae bacterium]|nr:hypothetical protein [Ignavibacteriaceae bacterium]
MTRSSLKTLMAIIVLFVLCAAVSGYFVGAFWLFIKLSEINPFLGWWFMGTLLMLTAGAYAVLTERKGW